MASDELPPAVKKSAPTIISSLGDDLVHEVFLRLPSLPSLVRAAFTCTAFLRAVSSSPKFRRRFRDLHPAPLLGVFLDIYDPDVPTFVPNRRRSDPDHAAVVRGTDVFLTRVPDQDEDEAQDNCPLWSITECRDGYVVLVNWRTKRAAVYDPITQGLHPIPAPPKEVCEDPEDAEVEFHVVTSEEDRRSFRVLLVCGSEERSRAARVAVFSPDSSEWQISISPEAGGLQQLQVEDDGTLVNGCVYWANGDNIHVLDAATLQFSRMDAPPTRMEWPRGSKFGETSDGKLCMAWTSDRDRVLDVSIWRADGDDGVHKWMPGTSRLELLDAIDGLKLPFEKKFPSMLQVDVVAVIGGTVYLSTFEALASSRRYYGWFLSFCIETEDLKKVCGITRSDYSYPYVMAWPPVLVRNKVNSISNRRA
ncbi:uncharacterized protein LOC123397266 [Hordeum vulgare subsp. vulgare]|uniref:uncharacterized protein LOC123397266 n=1 Tax=Hordeum vulgare subsp. vulgare TaxID=112509 RepID=UPI001D1A37CB|nr:uncharacterized protein LOC123397266 [Hordeum vulgare subsp. vulgare]